METKNRGIRALAILALLVAVAGISVAFAALSQSVNFTTGGKVKGGNFKIIWTDASGDASEGASEGSAAGQGTVTLTISDVVLVKPSDVVTWIITATNDGDFDARLQSLPTPAITWDPATFTKGTIDLTNEDGSPIVVGQKLAVGASANYKLTITFDEDTTTEEMPEEDVELTITATFPWVQD